MAIVKMKRLRLFAMRSQLDELLQQLLLLGCVEVSELGGKLEDPEWAALLHRGESRTPRLKAQYGSCTAALEALGRYAPYKTSMFANRRIISDSDLFSDELLTDAVALADRLNDLDVRLKRLAAEENQIKNVIASLKPWVPLGIPLQTEGTQYTAVVFGTLPSSTELKDAQAALEAAVGEAQLFLSDSGAEQHALALVAHRQSLSAALAVLRPLGFSVVTFKDMYGTAAENIERRQAQLSETRENIEQLRSEVPLTGPQRDLLMLAIDRLAQELQKSEAADRLLVSDSVVALEGWTTQPEEGELEALLKRFDCAYELTEPTEEQYPDVPIKLKNGKLSEPMMMVTEMYSLPAYDGIDPNPLIMPFFSIFFGIMYADIGYGVILLILGLLGRHFIKRRGTIHYMTGLLVLCGVTTIICGVLFGSCFGDAIPVFTNLIGVKQAQLWKLIDPLEQPMVMLVGSLVIGVIQILVGMAINAVMLCRRGKWLDALFDVGSWWVLFAGIALGALGITWWVCLAGAAALILTQGRAKPTLVGKLVGGLASLYDITSYLGDILSYTRLMALLLASSVIGSVVNVLGSLSGSVVVFIIVFLIGHAFNMGINIIGTYVHAARLQYLEFFGKFYKDGGRAFAPLAVNTKYVDIKEEN